MEQLLRQFLTSFIACSLIISTVNSQCYESGELVPNGDFEGYTVCPSQPNIWTTVDDWFKPFLTSPDFSNPGCYPSFTNVATPLPSGSSCAHFLAGNVNNPNSNNECLATCLSTPMVAGVTYTISIHLTATNSNPNPNPLSFGFWGVTNCNDLLDNGAPYAGGCLSNIPAMIPMAEGYNLAVSNAWQQFTFTYTPTVDIYGIAIGGLCSGIPGAPPFNNGGSYYMDNVSITATVPSLSISAGPDQVINCIDTTTTLNESATDGYPNYTINWSPTTNLSDPTILNPIATPQTTTTYTLTVTDVSGCTRTDSVVVTVDKNPPPVDAGPDVELCEGDSTTLLATGASSYNWSNGLPNGAVISPNSTQTLEVTGIGANGCTNTDDTFITVHPKPIFDAGADQTICLNDSILLEITGNDTYSWSTGAINGNYYSPPVGILEIVATGTSIFGCTHTDTLEVTVLAPTIDAGPNQILCENELVTLNAVSNSPFSWNQGIQNNVPFYQDTGSVYYFATATNMLGCSAMDSVLIYIEALKDVSFSADLVEGCSPLTVTFSNTTQGDLIDCFWEFSNNYTVNDCGEITITFESPGLFDVGLTVTSANNCVSTALLEDYIYVEEDPVANFTMSPNDPDILHPEVFFSNESIGATSYEWNFGDGSPISTSTDPQHTYQMEVSSGYQIELIAYSPLMCSDTAYREILIADELIFYVPNSFTPNGDEHNQTFQPVFTSGFDPFDYHLTIFNRWGEVIFESYNAEIGWDGHCVNGLCNDGIYTWKIEFKRKATDERSVQTGHVTLFR